jgi:hypothetical protein
VIDRCAKHLRRKTVKERASALIPVQLHRHVHRRRGILLLPACSRPSPSPLLIEKHSTAPHTSGAAPPRPPVRAVDTRRRYTTKSPSAADDRVLIVFINSRMKNAKTPKGLKSRRGLKKDSRRRRPKPMPLGGLPHSLR